MTQRSVTYLKARFETGDIPTQSDYQDVFDSFLSLESSASQSLAGKLIVPSLQVSGAVTADSVVCSSLTVNNINVIGSGSYTFDRVVASAATFNNAVSAGSIFADDAVITSVRAATVSAGNLFANAAKIAIVSANTVNAAEVSAVNLRAVNAIIPSIGSTIVSATDVSAGTLYANSGKIAIVSANTINAAEVSATNLRAVNAVIPSIGSTIVSATDVSAGTIYANAAKLAVVSANTVNSTEVSAVNIRANNTVSQSVGSTIVSATTVSAGTVVADTAKLATVSANNINTATVTADTVTTSALRATLVSATNLYANQLHTPDAGQLTIVAGVVSAAGSYHTIETSGGVAADFLHTINGGVQGKLLVIRAADNTHTVNVQNVSAVGNIIMGGPFALDSADDTLTLFKKSDTEWVCIAQRNNGS